jgi:hypothetical protein
MQINIKKEEKNRRIEKALKNNLKKRKLFQDNINNKSKKKK